MQWKVWQKPDPQELTDTLKHTLMSQFQLPPDKADQLRSLDQEGRLDGRPVRFIRIFDPGRVAGGMLARPKYHSFQLLLSGDRQALCFEGHFEADGTVVLADRRYPLTNFRPAKIPAAPRR